MKRLILSLSLASAGAFAQPASALYTFSTANPLGPYHQIGQTVCQIVSRADAGIKCSPSVSQGSIANLRRLAAGDAAFAVAESGWLDAAYKGEKTFTGEANPKLRVLFSVHPEFFTVIVRPDKNINNFDDLKGKRVNIGEAGSGARAAAELLLAEKGWTHQDFALASELKAAEVGDALCNNQIDAFLFNGGHPNGVFAAAMDTCGAKLLPVTGDAAARITGKYPYYSKAQIPAGLYKTSPDGAESFAVYADVVSTSDVPEEAVYQTVKAVFENLPRFQKAHAAFAGLTPEGMLHNGITIPFHDGAARYYREQGWIK